MTAACTKQPPDSVLLLHIQSGRWRRFREFRKRKRTKVGATGRLDMLNLWAVCTGCLQLGAIGVPFKGEAHDSRAGLGAVLGDTPRPSPGASTIELAPTSVPGRGAPVARGRRDGIEHRSPWITLRRTGQRTDASKLQTSACSRTSPLSI